MRLLAGAWGAVWLSGRESEPAVPSAPYPCDRPGLREFVKSVKPSFTSGEFAGTAACRRARRIVGGAVSRLPPHPTRRLPHAGEPAGTS